MTNEILFRGKAVVTQVQTGKVNTYIVELYNGSDRAIFSRNVQISKNNGNNSPSDVAWSVFQEFLNQGDYNRLPDKERLALAEYLAETIQTNDPKKAESAKRRLAISQGCDLGEIVDFNITLLKRDTSGRIKIYF